MALWDTPHAPPLDAACGDLAPRDLGGEHVVYAEGHWDGCDGGTGTATPFSGCLTLVVEQDPSDLAHGTVRFVGASDPRLGQPMSATFVRRGFRVMLDEMPGTCTGSVTVSFTYDEESYPLGMLDPSQGCVQKSPTFFPPSICTVRPPPPNTSGVMYGCASPDGVQLYLVMIETDEGFCSDGWFVTDPSKSCPGTNKSMPAAAANMCHAAVLPTLGVPKYCP